MNIKRMSYNVLKEAGSERIIGSDLTVFYLLEGKMSVQCQEEFYSMEAKDILLVNPGLSYELCDLKNAIYGKAVFSMAAMSEFLNGSHITFYCNSCVDRTRSYQDLRDIFFEITTVYASGKKESDCLINSLLLKLLDLLVESYQLKPGKEANSGELKDSRMQMIMQYIMANLDQEISLNELAADMYVSPSTLSRIFKKNTGMYFADYVLQLRVQSSLGLLSFSERTITQIAMTCGFSNSAAFNRAFRKVMNQTPSEYREQYRSIAAGEALTRSEQEEEIRKELIEKGYQNNGQDLKAEITLDMNALQESELHNNWNRMINIGPIWDITKANVQFHTLFLNEQLGFIYVRLWNIFSKKMLINDGKTLGQYNYDMVDQALDFLVSHRLKPFLEFGRRPDTAIRSHGHDVFYEDQYIDFESRENWECLIDDFLQHIAERYGTEEVSEWIFELTQDCFHGDQPIYRDEHFDLFEAYRFLYHAVRTHAPGAKFGGIGHDISVDRNYLTQFFHRCTENNLKPDFLSFILFPYELQGKTDGGFEGKVSRNEKFELMQLDRIRKLMDITSLKDSELYITEWNISISNRNILNDSGYRAAYLVRHMPELSEYTDMIGIMSGTDWVSSYMDTSGLANGGIGLLTRDLLKKPAYYALRFLNHCGNTILFKGENCIVSRRDNGDFYILCFYYTRLNRDYDMENEDIGIEAYDLMPFEKSQPFTLKILLNNIEQPGSYCMKKRTVNREHGDLLEEWRRFQYDTRLTREDIKYFDAACTPSMSMARRTVDSSNKSLELEITMQPTEITLIHIFRRK